jgi:hypothetical protein
LKSSSWQEIIPPQQEVPMHLNDDALRAYADHAWADMAGGAAHLATCAVCRGRLDALRDRAGRVAAHLASLDPGLDAAPRPAVIALAQFNARKQAASQQEKPTMFKRLFAPGLRPAWIGIGLVLVLAIALSFQPVRVWAGNLLGMFRVQQVVVLPVDNTRLSAITGDDALGQQISQMMSDSVKVTKDPGDPAAVPDAQAASDAAGFQVRLPTSRSDAPKVTVQAAAAFEFVADRNRAQDILNQAGFTDVQLPASVDGALIKVNIPAGVTAAYGDCPKLADESSVKGSIGRTMLNCIVLAQIPSPTVIAPPDLDVAAMAQIGLQFTGMTAEQAQAFSQSVDWTSTLVVPIPRNGAKYAQVPVDGVTGSLIQRPLDDAPEYSLIWVKNGIIYAIGGLGNNVDAAVAMANSLSDSAR